jgi:multiple sugar transport system substrate-binding protein
MLNRVGWKMLRTAVLVCLVVVAFAACGGGGSSQQASELTMWTRDTAEDFNKTLVEEWNRTHDTKIKVTVIPVDQYVTKVSTSGASGDLPDLLSADLIYMPQFNKAGIMADITDRVDALEYKDELSPAHMQLGEWEGKQYAVPYFLDASTLFYNKELFRRAGLDPNDPPKSWVEVEEYAKKISALGGDVHGFYFAGNSAGFNAFTLLPLVWAQGGEIITEDGQARMDSPEVERALETYRGLWTQDLAPDAAKSEDGANLLPTFATGRIGMMSCGNYCIPALKESAPKLDFGNTLIPGPEGGRSSFGGGDVISISAASENQDQAWEYIEWVLSEETQVEVIAKSGYMVDRTDLTDNEYADALTQVQNEALTVAETPKTLGYNEIFNDPNGPWGNMVNSAIIGGDVEGAMAQAQKRSQEILDQTGS